MTKQFINSFAIAFAFSTFAIPALAKSTQQLSPQDEINRIADEIEPMLEDENDFVVLKPVNGKKGQRPFVVKNRKTTKSVKTKTASPGRTKVIVADNSGVNTYRPSNAKANTGLDISMPGISIMPVVGAGSYGVEGSLIDSKFNNEGSVAGGVNILLGRGELQVDTGILYAQHSVTQTGSSANYINGFLNYQNMSVQYDVSYIEIPFALRYKFNLTDSFNIFARGGVQFAYRLDAKASSSNATNTLNAYQVTDEDAKNSFNELETRGIVSLGAAYKFTSSLAVSLQADYQRGITKTSNGFVNLNGISENTELTSSVLGVSAGLIWEI